MANWRLNRQRGANPNFVERGGALSNSYFFGFQALGRGAPIQADPDDIAPYRPQSVACLPEVIEWPWATDNAGLAFDQANLYGVRWHCWNDSANGNQDSDTDWVAVPRALDASLYTWQGRPWGNPYGADGLTVSASGNNGYRLRLPTNTFYPSADPHDKQFWAPSNLGQSTLSGSVSPSGNFWTAIGADTYALLNYGQHVGYRDATFTVSLNQTGFEPPGRYVEVRVYWDEPDVIITSPTLPANLLWSQSVPYTSMSGAIPGLTTYTIASSGSLIHTRHYPVNYYIVLKTNGGTGSPIPGIVVTFKLGPRIDIPLPFTATDGNLIAPGGYLT